MSKPKQLPNTIYVVIAYNKVGKEIVVYRTDETQAQEAAQFFDEFHDGKMPKSRVYTATALD